MKTLIRRNEDWEIIKEYDFLFSMNRDDIIVLGDKEYRVKGCSLEIENDTIIILIDDIKYYDKY